MTDIYLETCRICFEIVPVESNILQIYDCSCVKFLEELQEISGVNFNGVFEQPWYICMNCYSSLLSAQAFRKKCNESYEKIKEFQRKKDQIPTNEELLEEILSYNPENVVENENITLGDYESENASNQSPRVIIEPAIGKTKVPIKIKEFSNICEICGNVFEKTRNFKIHLARHSNTKRFECEICLSKFYTQSELKCHMRKHTGEKPYECRYCHRKFSDYGTHKYHERTHTNERPFCCGFCNKGFKNRFMLNNHILIHSGKRKYRCNVCNKAFLYSGHLRSHLKTLSHLKQCKLAEEEAHENAS